MGASLIKGMMVVFIYQMKLHIDFACSPILLCGRLSIQTLVPPRTALHRYRWYSTCIDVYIALGCIYLALFLWWYQFVCLYMFSMQRKQPFAFMSMQVNISRVHWKTSVDYNIPRHLSSLIRSCLCAFTRRTHLGSGLAQDTIYTVQNQVGNSVMMGTPARDARKAPKICPEWKKAKIRTSRPNRSAKI